jgi:hypothetical protein
LNRYVQPFELFKTVVAIAISIFAGGLYFFITTYIHRIHYINQVKTHFADIIGNSVELQVTNDAIETKDKTGETKTKLTEIKIVYETDNLFILQSDSGNCLTIPKQDIDFAGFRNCLISHGMNLEMYGKK